LLKILSLHTHSGFSKPVLICIAEQKEKCFEECKQAAFFKISSFVLSSTKKYIQVWNNLRVKLLGELSCQVRDKMCRGFSPKDLKENHCILGV